MGHGFKSGGGGAGISLRIVAYGTEADLLASSAPDNVIGIVTSNAISDYSFSSAEPDGLSDGGIWIKTGVTGNVSVNILRKNEIRLELISCHQLVSGELVRRLAYLRKDGSWIKFAVSWDGYYFNSGEQYTEITGGWIEWDESSDAASPVIGDVLTAQSPLYSGKCVIGTQSPIDLTDVSAIRFNSVGAISGAGATAYAGSILITENPSTASPKKSTLVSTTGEGSIDVSDLSGVFYLCLSANGGSSGAGFISIDKIWKE